MWEYNYSEELYHYGVLGMTWGVRRGNASKAFYKAVKKANQIDEKATKKKVKGSKLEYKGLKKQANSTSEKKYKKGIDMTLKGHKLTLKAAKLEKKGLKWEKKMKETFSEVSIKDINQEHLEYGKKYAYMLTK